MKFSEELNNYMNILECSAKDICNVSGLSYTLLNRYINDKRTPSENSKYFDRLVEALYQISIKKNINFPKEKIFETLSNAINSKDSELDYNSFLANFNLLQDSLGITTIEMSKAIGYDASFISRMKNKERKPSDIESFIDKLRNYIVLTFQSKEKKEHISTILNCSASNLQNIEQYKQIFTNWICSKHIENKTDDVLNFLTKLDNFDLNDYIGTDFSKVKVPTSPIIFKNSKTYFGIEGRKQAEGEFLKTTLLSKSNEPIFFYSDLPIADAGEDEKFKQKWVYAMTALLKKGLHLNMIHNLNRPINEMLLGLESWIPIYMTGSISPYYFKTPPSNFFMSSLYTSGSVALFSECIKYNEKKCRFYLTTKKEEVEFEKERAKYMLSKATPLMEIYKENDKEKFDAFMSSEKNKEIQKIEKDIFKNIDFCINEDKWVMINKKTSPEIHFVIFYEKLMNAIKNFLLI